MSQWAILGTGPSMSQAVADRCRSTVLHSIAVSNSYLIAPWADAVVSSDVQWWDHHPAALLHAGRKFIGSSFRRIDGVEPVKCEGPIMQGSNSGLLAMHVAVALGATELFLHGFDMRGSHFFGFHPPELKNTPLHRFEVFKRQFERYQPRGVTIWNCTPGSALRCYDFLVDDAVNRR